eukprot:4227591-Pyramimonas_sp.AAC.1
MRSIGRGKRRRRKKRRWRTRALREEGDEEEDNARLTSKPLPWWFGPKLGFDLEPCELKLPLET